jgi:hypothetical protein
VDDELGWNRDLIDNCRLAILLLYRLEGSKSHRVGSDFIERSFKLEP